MLENIANILQKNSMQILNSLGLDHPSEDQLKIVKELVLTTVLIEEVFLEKLEAKC